MPPSREARIGPNTTRFFVNLDSYYRVDHFRACEKIKSRTVECPWHHDGAAVIACLLRPASRTLRAKACVDSCITVLSAVQMMPI